MQDLTPGNFGIGEAVNNVLMVYGVIPKRLFRRKTKYWAAEAARGEGKELFRIQGSRF